MNDTSKQSGQEAPREHPAMGQIVGYLKDYPFLLITIAGLLILSGILIFDLEKLKEFKWLIYGVVLVPLVIQFFIEYQKIAARRAAERGTTVAPPVGAPIPAPMPASGSASGPATLPVSTKALWSLALLVMLLLALNETTTEEFRDRDLMLGYLIFSGSAVVLAWLALGDVRRQRARGKVLAIFELAVATLFTLAALGWLSEANPPPVTPSAAVQPGVQSAVQPPQVLTVQSDDGESTVAAVSPPDTGVRTRAPTESSGGATLVGQYVLRDFSIGGMPITVNGALSISRASSDIYQWQAHYAGQGLDGVQTENSSGQFIRRDGLWYQRIIQSDASDWEGPGEVPMQMTHDGTNLQFRYGIEGTEIVATWQRDME